MTRPGYTTQSTRSSWPGSMPRDYDPPPTADRATLLRRVSLDLIGLPPTPEEVDAFLADRVARRLREAGRPVARLASLWRALGAALARSGALCRHQRLREGPPALDLAVPRLGDQGDQRRSAVRSIHDRAARRRHARGRDSRAEGCDRLPSQHDAQRGRGNRPAGISLLRHDRPGRTPPERSGWG